MSLWKIFYMFYFECLFGKMEDPSCITKWTHCTVKMAPKMTIHVLRRFYGLLSIF